MYDNMKMPWLRFIEGAGDGPVNNDTEPNKPEPKEPEKETDWQAEAEKWKQHSRTWEDRAKSNSEARKKLDELEEQDKTEAEKLAARLKEADERAAQLEEREKALATRELVTNIAVEFNISKDDRDLYLTGSDEDTLRKQAEGLAARRGPENPHQGRGSGGPNKQSAQDWAKSLLGK